MNTNESPVMNSPDERQEQLSRDLDNFASPESGTTGTPERHEDTPTPSVRKTGRFASMAATADSSLGQGTYTTPLSVRGGTAAGAQAQAGGGQTQVVAGRIVDAGMNEPKWTKEQLQEFATLRSTRMEMVAMNESRKAIPDRERKYVVKNSDGTCSAMANSMLPNLPLSAFKIGLGVPKPDERLPKMKMYSDVVIIHNNEWFLNQ